MEALPLPARNVVGSAHDQQTCLRRNLRTIARGRGQAGAWGDPLGLEGATTLYAEGLALAKKCGELLEATERKLRRIQENQVPSSKEKGDAGSS